MRNVSTKESSDTFQLSLVLTSSITKCMDILTDLYKNENNFSFKTRYKTYKCLYTIRTIIARTYVAFLSAKKLSQTKMTQTKKIKNEIEVPNYKELLRVFRIYPKIREKSMFNINFAEMEEEQRRKMILIDFGITVLSPFADEYRDIFDVVYEAPNFVTICIKNSYNLKIRVTDEFAYFVNATFWANHKFELNEKVVKSILSFYLRCFDWRVSPRKLFETHSLFITFLMSSKLAVLAKKLNEKAADYKARVYYRENIVYIEFPAGFKDHRLFEVGINDRRIYIKSQKSIFQPSNEFLKYMQDGMLRNKAVEYICERDIYYRYIKDDEFDADAILSDLSNTIIFAKLYNKYYEIKKLIEATHDADLQSCFKVKLPTKTTVAIFIENNNTIDFSVSDYGEFIAHSIGPLDKKCYDLSTVIDEGGNGIMLLLINFFRGLRFFFNASIKVWLTNSTFIIPTEWYYGNMSLSENYMALIDSRQASIQVVSLRSRKIIDTFLYLQNRESFSCKLNLFDKSVENLAAYIIYLEIADELGKMHIKTTKKGTKMLCTFTPSSYCVIKVGINEYWSIKFYLESFFIKHNHVLIVEGHSITHRFPKSIANLVSAVFGLSDLEQKLEAYNTYETDFYKFKLFNPIDCIGKVSNHCFHIGIESYKEVYELNQNTTMMVVNDFRIPSSIITLVGKCKINPPSINQIIDLNGILYGVYITVVVLPAVYIIESFVIDAPDWSTSLLDEVGVVHLVLRKKFTLTISVVNLHEFIVYVPTYGNSGFLHYPLTLVCNYIPSDEKNVSKFRVQPSQLKKLRKTIEDSLCVFNELEDLNITRYVIINNTCFGGSSDGVTSICLGSKGVFLTSKNLPELNKALNNIFNCNIHVDFNQCVSILRFTKALLKAGPMFQKEVIALIERAIKVMDKPDSILKKYASSTLDEANHLVIVTLKNIDPNIFPKEAVLATNEDSIKVAMKTNLLEDEYSSIDFKNTVREIAKH